jgi:hypothetical protein
MTIGGHSYVATLRYVALSSILLFITEYLISSNIFNNVVSGDTQTVYVVFIIHYKYYYSFFQDFLSNLITFFFLYCYYIPSLHLFP